MNNVVLVKLRGLLNAQMLRKNLKLSQSTARSAPALSLMTADIESVINGTKQFHDVLVAIPEIGVALFLLSREVGDAFFLPVSTILGKSSATLADTIRI